MKGAANVIVPVPHEKTPAEKEKSESPPKFLKHGTILLEKEES